MSSDSTKAAEHNNSHDVGSKEKEKVDYDDDQQIVGHSMVTEAEKQNIANNSERVALQDSENQKTLTELRLEDKETDLQQKHDSSELEPAPALPATNRQAEEANNMATSLLDVPLEELLAANNGTLYADIAATAEPPTDIEQQAEADAEPPIKDAETLASTATEVPVHAVCLAELRQQRQAYEEQLQQLHALLAQKDNIIVLHQRENAILEKEKDTFRKEKEAANREKESVVIKFAMKEKLLLDAKKEKEAIEKRLAESKKEVKNVSTRFQALQEEKSRMVYIIDEKCAELRKYQRECERLRTESGHMDSKLKYHVNKLQIETDAKLALEKKLEEESNKFEEKANEKLKMEYEASAILLKHEVANKEKANESLKKEQAALAEKLRQTEGQVSSLQQKNTELSEELDNLRQEFESVQNLYSSELLSGAKLRGQLEELQVLRTQNTLNEEKISTLTQLNKEQEERLQDNASDLEELRARVQELLSINKEMSESIVNFQNEICLMKHKSQAAEAECEFIKKECAEHEKKYAALEKTLEAEKAQNNQDRVLLTKHLAEKTKLYELAKEKLDNMAGDLEATNKKHAQTIKELQREIHRYKKCADPSRLSNIPVPDISPPKSQSNMPYTENVQKLSKALNGFHQSISELPADEAADAASSFVEATTSRQCSTNSGRSSRRTSESAESAASSNALTSTGGDVQQGPSKKLLVERILRLQQASARQTEKIEFLENHTLSLVTELQKKSKVVQYYMLREQGGALTSNKSDQNKRELAKYGAGVMSAIYGGIKNGNQSDMTIELSLEINKKLQAVLEDTLLKNITLKENLNVLGLEVDKLTRKLAKHESVPE